MTLLGKIFRPWDLTSGETFVSKSSKSREEEEDSVCDVKAALVNDKSVIVASSASRKISPAVSLLASSGVTRRSEESAKSSAEEPHSPASASPSMNPISLAAGSVSSVYPSGFLDLNPGNVPYYIPSSPVGTQTSAAASAAGFMSTSSINELASLSRTELTAMGLLPPEPPASMKVKRQRPKRFRCPHCQVAFSNNGQLRGHIRIHTGERPFACDHEGCGKSFTRNEELTRHRRIHTGLRPYPCTHCGKKFGRKDHLKKHTRTHQRPMYNTSAGMIGLGNPFHPYNPSLIPSHSAINEFGSPSSPFALPFMLSIPPPISHFPFS